MDPLLKCYKKPRAQTVSARCHAQHVRVGSRRQNQSYEADQVILGYRAILNEEKLDLEVVRALM